MLRVWALLALVCAVQAVGLHHALKHHSSLPDAAHRQDHVRTRNWLLFDAASCDETFAAEIRRQLATSAGPLHVGVQLGIQCVLTASSDTDANELAAVLLSEQRAGRLSGFERERVNKHALH